jgi:hypothetical protein
MHVSNTLTTTTPDIDIATCGQTVYIHETNRASSLCLLLMRHLHRASHPATTYQPRASDCAPTNVLAVDYFIERLALSSQSCDACQLPACLRCSPNPSSEILVRMPPYGNDERVATASERARRVATRPVLSKAAVLRISEGQAQGLPSVHTLNLSVCAPMLLSSSLHSLLLRCRGRSKSVRSRTMRRPPVTTLPIYTPEFGLILWAGGGSELDSVGGGLGEPLNVSINGPRLPSGT